MKPELRTLLDKLKPAFETLQDTFTYNTAQLVKDAFTEYGKAVKDSRWEDAQTAIYSISDIVTKDCEKKTQGAQAGADIVNELMGYINQQQQAYETRIKELEKRVSELEEPQIEIVKEPYDVGTFKPAPMDGLVEHMKDRADELYGPK